VLLARLLREQVRPHGARLALAALLMAVVAGATAANAWIMQPVLDSVFVGKDARMLYLVAGGVLALALAKGVATYFQGVLMQGVGLGIVADVQSRLFAHLMRADLAWFHDVSSGKLVSNFLVDANLLREATSRALTGLAKDFLTLIALVAVMFWQNWELSLIAFFVFPLAGAFTRRYGKRMRKASTVAQEQSGTLTAMLGESFQGNRLIKAYGMEERESMRARAAILARVGSTMRLVRIRGVSSSAMEALGYVAVAAVIFYGGLQVIDGRTTPGTFFSFITALLLAFQPMRSISTLNAALQEGLAAAERIFALLDVRPDVLDAPDAKPLALAGGSVTFENVSFAYKDGTAAISGMSFAVPAGTKAALVGPSGGGKSTALNLIPRFFDPTGGRVTIDGQDVRGATLASVRGAIALVSQEAQLFDDTIRANIAFGRPGASEAEIERAARLAAAHDFIRELPRGYDTMAGETGVKLSGGQRQRIAIARAMLKDAPILLLDEATSALDSESERQIQGALEALAKGRTSIVIAHRLSTVVDADRIYVIDGGRIVEEGRHGELVERGGLYARLWALQGAEAAA
jgi:subfamily B ATP-binding cassette protein MsbA